MIVSRETIKNLSLNKETDFITIKLVIRIEENSLQLILDQQRVLDTFQHHF